MEWMCVICGFDNKPRSKHCIMCGTTYQFSLEYKCEKTEMKRKRKDIKSITASKTSVSSSSSKVNVDSVAIAFDNVVGNRGEDIESGRLSTVPESNSTSSFSLPNNIFSTPEKGTSTASAAVIGNEHSSGIDSAATSSVFFSTTIPTTRNSLSGAKRREALNYRRLNQLSLRQKSARRRKM